MNGEGLGGAEYLEACIPDSVDMKTAVSFGNDQLWTSDYES